MAECVQTGGITLRYSATTKVKSYWNAIAFSCGLFFIANPAHAMHIMEGYLPLKDCLLWAVLSFPAVVMGFIEIDRRIKESPKTLVLLALCGAFAFALSAFKIPTLGGSSSHPTGVAFGAILLGAFPMTLISVLILLFQAILLAHGGISTLGANVFSMGVVGPLAAVGAYRLALKVTGKKELAFFLAAFLGNLSTYTVTAFQLALAYPMEGNVLAALHKFSLIFAVTQIPIAIAEGFMTVFLLGLVEKYRADLLETGRFKVRLKEGMGASR